MDKYFMTNRGMNKSNMLVYCENNPINRVDMFGTCWYDAKGNWRHDNWEYKGNYKRQPKPAGKPNINITYKLNKTMRNNAEELRNYRKENGYASAVGYFISKVKTGGDWDFKNQKSWNLNRDFSYTYKNETLRFDDIGNIHYGYVGRELFGVGMLVAGGGAYQIKTDYPNIQWNHFWSLFDDPQDQWMVIFGSTLWDADDNVMPQTKEAINHAMAAGVPIVFAINKVDKPHANPDKIKEELAAMNFLVEEWGGKYQSQDISAKKGTGVHELLEKVLLEAEMLDLKANPDRKATGSIIESTLDKGRGYVATILVSNGTLRMGDIVLAGTSYGKVKAMFNERNQRIKEAGPSEPVLILGLNGAPAAGDTFHVIDTEQEAREIANKREQLQREQGLRTQKMLTLDEVGRRLALGDFHELNIIVKGDVDGSVEALSDSLIKLSTEQVQVNVIHKGVGQISESDVTLAAASNAIIVGFQVRPSSAAAKMAEQDGVDIRKYSVIYDAIEEVKAAMEGMLAPTLKEQVTATIEVREVFNISKVGIVAGAMVKTGKVKRSDKARLIRDGIVVFTGTINALKRFKDDVKEVGTNFECGISLTNCNDIKVEDIIETYEEVEVKQTL